MLVVLARATSKTSDLLGQRFEGVVSKTGGLKPSSAPFGSPSTPDQNHKNGLGENLFKRAHPVVTWLMLAN
jgi:hypothetical protein